MTTDDVEVWLDETTVGPVRVGTLRPSFQGGRTLASSSFQYDAEYLSRADRYAISPDLPLTSARQYAPETRALFGAFSDAAPDEWGRKIVEANHAQRRRRDAGLPRRIGDFDLLLGVSDFTRMGALRLRRSTGSEWLSSDDGVANIHDLERVLQVARRYEANEASDEDIEYLNDVATSPGGARPKANVILADGTLAIAKLPHSKDGNIDVENWEAFALTIADEAGLSVPTWYREPAADDKTVLIVSRFDRAQNRRRGYLSAASALEVNAYDDRRVTYEDFADTISEISVNPRDDLREMFARIALTVLINNTDDHWRNHGFLHTTGGWRLAPAFDVNPNPRRGGMNSRPINHDDDPRARDLRNLVAIASSYRLTPEQSREIVLDMAVRVDGWRQTAHSLGISAAQQDMMAPAFDQDQIDYAKSPG